MKETILCLENPKKSFVDPVLLREYITCPKCGKKMIVYCLKTGKIRTIHPCGVPFDYEVGKGLIIRTKESIFKLNRFTQLT